MTHGDGIIKSRINRQMMKARRPSGEAVRNPNRAFHRCPQCGMGLTISIEDHYLLESDCYKLLMKELCNE